MRVLAAFPWFTYLFVIVMSKTHSPCVVSLCLSVPTQPRHLNEALLLMAKIHYVQGCYHDAQGMCARVGIDELTGDEQPLYHLRLLAEAFVIKGTNPFISKYWVV